MYACMYVYAYIYVCVKADKHKSVYRKTFIYVHIYTYYKHACIYANIYMHRYTCM